MNSPTSLWRRRSKQRIDEPFFVDICRATRVLSFLGTRAAADERTDSRAGTQTHYGRQLLPASDAVCIYKSLGRRQTTVGRDKLPPTGPDEDWSWLPEVAGKRPTNTRVCTSDKLLNWRQIGPNDPCALQLPALAHRSNQVMFDCSRELLVLFRCKVLVNGAFVLVLLGLLAWMTLHRYVGLH